MQRLRSTRRAALAVIVIASCAAGLCAAVEPPQGAGYRVVSGTLDGGTPQTAAHAPSGYRLRGSIGQPDAATSSAGSLRLEGGFWPSKDRPATGPIFADGFESP
jgi:hypothetical protein